MEAENIELNEVEAQGTLLLEVCLESGLGACAAGRVDGQRQLVQRRTTVAEVVVWQQFHTRQLQQQPPLQYTIYVWLATNEIFHR